MVFDTVVRLARCGIAALWATVQGDLFKLGGLALENDFWLGRITLTHTTSITPVAPA
jgi:hypothetical protein